MESYSQTWESEINKINHEFSELPEINISYFETGISTSHSRNASIISSHWQRFNSLLRVNNVQLGTNWKKYGITVKTDDIYKYQCAYKTETPIPQFGSAKIPGGHFAKFNHAGPIDKISRTINYIYKIAIPQLSLPVDKNRSILHIEKYDSKFNWNSDESVVEILLPIEGLPTKC
jgi:predicted transcriptional regulator YdeE